MFDQNISVIFNSRKDVFLFNLSEEGEIIYTIYDSSLNKLQSNFLFDKNILKYSTLIDENDFIHLVALLNTGELNYYKYINDEWVKDNIAKFDLKSNLYNQIKILIIKDNLHIIYNYSNIINSNIWTIQHVVLNDKNGEKHNAIRYISKRVADPFFVDVDSSGNIHVVYKTYINNDSQIYHGFYNPFTRTWSSVSKHISSSDFNNIFPFLFIDSQNNLHILWIEESINKLNLKYLRMKGSGKEKYIWKEISLPHISLSKNQPIIFEENNKLKLIYFSNDSMILSSSKDYGDSWVREEIMPLPQNISIAKVNSNILPSENQIKYGYLNILDKPIFYFLELYSKSSILTYDKATSESESINEDTNIEVDEKKSHELVDINPISFHDLMEVDKKLEKIIENQYILTKILDNQLNIENNLSNIQINIENKLDDIQKSIDSNKKSFFNNFFNS
ncbi:hypothetical protein RBU61_09935 [Tissierella sp. MB52-C2]|uniref:hypothetical protein n=1 Tax=Tissierella sp. MB52-C2 TaxID=3070999 RepID=UPI00280A586A|nr:hypothetical protein [Tissierella sp. MB52-C2]WMM23275.1 hypothetical protein RBU61_09935 [Tissierella sp. MB52-C2]